MSASVASGAEFATGMARPERSGPGATLRALLERPVILEQPSICDPFGARMAAEAGFESISLAGYAIGAHLPLSAQLTLKGVERMARAVSAAAGLPLLVDADAGWTDGARGMAGVVGTLEAAGAAAVQLSSQHIPDRVPFDERSERGHAADRLVERISAAAALRTSMLVVARCDVDPRYGYADALALIRRFVAAGADAVLVHSVSEDDLRRFPRDVDVPVIYAGSPANPFEPSVFPAERLQAWGYRGVRNKYHQCHCARLLSGGTDADAEPRAESRR